MKLLSSFFWSKESETLSEQIEYCCHDINNWIVAHHISPAHIISCNVFIDAKTNLEYDSKKLVVHKTLELFFPGLVAFNLLAQSPQHGIEIAIEVHALPKIGNPKTELSKKKFDGIVYTRIQSEEDEKILFVNGIQQCIGDKEIISVSENLYQIMENILHREGMNFSHIVRQWNYIENITKKIETPKGGRQHYQIFNDVRAQYYSRNIFENSYPAATGIGTSAGGISISFYAVSGKNTICIPIENPLQVSAFSYSNNVLVGGSASDEINKNAPKFVRAKYVGTTLGQQLFISGTASIRGEQSMGREGVEQTKITLENIECLLSRENLKNSGLPDGIAVPRIQYLRVYVKSKKYLDSIKNVCLKTIPEVPILFVYADICRDDLLLEIEGIVELC